MPTDVVAGLLQLQHARSAAQLLRQLHVAGLARYETLKPGPFPGCRALRLWSLTLAGHDVLVRQGVDDPNDPMRWCPATHVGTRRVVRWRPAPLTVAAYRLLADAARALNGPVHVTAWESPWIRRLSESRTARARYVRLPAAAELVEMAQA